jgi:5-methylthioadenosine/S-adenosylhomocysteine deaminase
MADMIIKNGYLYTVNPERMIYTNGAIAISGQQIVAVGPTDTVLATHTAKETIDAQGKMVLPGLIDTHVHPALYLTGSPASVDPTVPNLLSRGGFIEDFTLRFITPGYNMFTPEESYAAAMGAYVAMIKSGTTCFNDGGNGEAGGLARAAIDLGMRGSVTQAAGDLTVNPDLPQDRLQRFAEVDKILLKSEAVVKQWNGAADGRIRAWFNLFFAPTCSDELCVETKRLADKYGVGIGCHATAVKNEDPFSVKHHGKRSLTRFHDLGILGTNFLGIHMGWPDDQEIGWLAEQKVKVAHCPITSSICGKGIFMDQRMPKMAEAGVTIGLGTDIAQQGRMLAQMTAAYLWHKEAYRESTIMPPQQVLAMATIDAARACLWDDEIGSLEVGKKADVIIVDTTDIRWALSHDPLGPFLLEGQGRDVETVIIDGRVVMRNRELLTVDEEKIKRELRQAATSMVKRRQGGRP